MMREPFARRTRVAALAIILALVAGCAANKAYRDGQDMLARGQLWEGVARLEEANRLRPTPQYRLAYITARDRVVGAIMARADAAVEHGDYDAAESLYREILEHESSNSRAAGGVEKARSRRSRDALYARAQASAQAQNRQDATAALLALLAEHPTYAPALALLRDLEAKAVERTSEAALSAAYSKPITIEFRDTPLKTIFEVISRSSGMNFLFDKEVRTDTKTSIFLKNSTIENAVRLLLLTNQLDQRVIDANTVLIYPNTAAKQREYQPLSVRSFYLSNADAKNVANTLKSILKTRDVVVDDKLNLVIMRDSPSAIRLAEKLVALHDVPDPEVMLEVEVLEIKRSSLVDFGIRWPEQAQLTPLTTSGGDSLTLADFDNLNRSTIGVGVGSTTLNAKQQRSDANLLANPRIRARNREEARILIGDRVPVITTTATSTGFISESVTYVDVGLKLTVQPTIYPDNEVAMNVALEVSNIVNQLQTKSGSLAYQIGTRTASTVLRLKDGENQVLAGLINDEDRRTANGVPGLADLPLLGRLFGSKATDKIKTEIVLSITPRVVRNMQRPPAEAAEFDTGTETSLRSSGGGESVAAASSASATSSGTTARQPATPRDPSTPPADNNNTTDPRFNSQSGGNVIPPVTGTPGSGGAIPAAQLRWQGPGSLQAGDTFALQLLMQSDQPIISIPAAIGFDTRSLTLMSVTEGDFLRQGGAQTSFNDRADPNGQVIITANRVGDGGATALGSVATLNFRVSPNADSETRIQLLAISPVGVGGTNVQAPLPQPHVITISR